MEFSFSEFLSVAGLHFLSVVSPGPDFALTVKSTLQRGRKGGVLTSLGIACGVIIHGMYSLLGLAWLFQVAPQFYLIVKWMGAAFLVYIGIMSLRKQKSASLQSSEPTMDQASAATLLKEPDPFMTGFITNVFNPKATLFFVSVFSQLISPETSFGSRLLYIAEMVLATALWFILVVELFSRARQNKYIQFFQTRLDQVMGVILIGIGIKVAIF